jgi:hypothetical protein
MKLAASALMYFTLAGAQPVDEVTTWRPGNYVGDASGSDAQAAQPTEAAVEAVQATGCSYEEAFDLIDANMPEGANKNNYDWRIETGLGNDGKDWQVWVWCLPPWQRYRVWANEDGEKIYDREQRWIAPENQTDYTWTTEKWDIPEAANMSDDSKLRTHNIYRDWKTDRLSVYQADNGRDGNMYIRSVGGLGYCNWSRNAWRWSATSDLPACPDFTACPAGDWHTDEFGECHRTICQNTCANGVGDEAVLCSKVKEHCATCDDGFAVSAGRCVSAAQAAEDNAARSDVLQRLEDNDANTCDASDPDCMSITLMWDNTADIRNDLDLHLTYTDDNGNSETLYYGNSDAFGGTLDVDHGQGATNPIENIYIPNAQKGTYQVMVKNYSYSGNRAQAFTVINSLFGQMEITRDEMPAQRKYEIVLANVSYDPAA